MVALGVCMADNAPGLMQRLRRLRWPAVSALRAESLTGNSATARAALRLRQYEFAALGLFILAGLLNVTLVYREEGSVAQTAQMATLAAAQPGSILNLLSQEPTPPESATAYLATIDDLARAQTVLQATANAADAPPALHNVFAGQGYTLSARMHDIIALARRLGSPVPPEDGAVLLSDMRREIVEQDAPRLADAAALFQQFATQRAEALRTHSVWAGASMLALALLIAVAFLPFEARQRRSVVLLEWLAARDSLTGALNRGAFSARLAVALAQASPTKAVGLIRFDLDNFRGLNRANGDAAGDAALHAVARRLRHAAGLGALVGRLGSDSFAVALPRLEGGHVGLAHEAARLADVLTRPLPFGDQLLHFTASAGTALAPQDSAQRSELMRMADVALRDAKRIRKGSVQAFHNEETAAQARREAVMAALASDDLRGLEPWLQPIIACTDNATLRFEVLARWRHPTLGQVSPGEFLPIAEAMGKLPRVSAEVRNAAFSVLAEMDAALLPAAPRLGLSVNLASAELAMPEVMPSLEAALAAAGLDLSRLVIELGEDMISASDADMLEALQSLRARGGQINLDNFGTGFASLSSLHMFPLDGLKIARPFIAGIGTSPRAEAIVRGVIGLAHGLGIAAVAEGVETDEQMEFVRAAGCDAAQGYFIAPPMPPAAAITWMQEQMPKPSDAP